MSDGDTMVVHFNALVHALKSQLLPQATYEEYLGFTGVERMTESLLDSSYRKDMAEALTRGHGADAIEDAVQHNRAHQVAMLSRRASGDFGDLVALFLARMDLAAVKYLIRAKHHGLAEDEILAAGNPGVSMTQPQFHDLARAESMEDLVTQLVA